MRNVAGSLYGLAYGDALGKPTEFEDYPAIVARYGAGAFAGAALGLAAWPDAWRERIEYTDRLGRLAAAWD